MDERKLACRYIVRRERAHGAKRSINLQKRHMKNILHLVAVYKVLIKLGSADIFLQYEMISAGTGLF